MQHIELAANMKHLTMSVHPLPKIPSLHGVLCHEPCLLETSPPGLAHNTRRPEICGGVKSSANTLLLGVLVMLKPQETSLGF